LQRFCPSITSHHLATLDKQFHWRATRARTYEISSFAAQNPPIIITEKKNRSIPAPECAIAESRPRFTAPVQAAPARQGLSRT
jgi:hypothetical protein